MWTQGIIDAQKLIVYSFLERALKSQVITCDPLKSLLRKKKYLKHPIGYLSTLSRNYYSQTTETGKMRTVTGLIEALIYICMECDC